MDRARGCLVFKQVLNNLNFGILSEFRVIDFLGPEAPKNYYTANVYRDLQGLCGGFLQYLQGKPCNIYRVQGDSRENL